MAKKRKTSKCSQSDRATKLLQQKKLKYNIKESFVKLERIDDAGTSINPEHDRNTRNPNIQQTFDHNSGEAPVKLERVDDRVVYEPAHAGHNQTESDTSEFDLVSNIEIVKNEISVVDDDTLNSFRKEVEHVLRNATGIVNNTRTMNIQQTPDHNLSEVSFKRRRVDDGVKIDPKQNKLEDVIGKKLSKTTTRRSRFKHHFMELAGRNPFPCLYCNRSFSQKNGIYEHIKIFHPTKPIYQCPLCRSKLYKPDEIDQHNFKCVKRRSFECLFCKFTTKKAKPYELKKHMQRAHTICERAFKCNICTKDYTGKVYLDRHIRNHHRLPTSNRRYECYLCKESCITVEDLRQKHMKIHLGKYNCKYCPNRYTCFQTHNRHVRKHHYHLFEFQCQICHGIIKNYKCVSKHERSCMKPITQSNCMIYFKCSLCGLGLPRVDELKKHVLSGECTNYKEKLMKIRKEKRQKIIQLRKEPQRFHLKPLETTINGKTIFKCPLCDFSSKHRRNYGFKAHFRKHTGEKPHHCLYCEKSYKSSEQFFRHIKTIHPTKPFLQCSLCKRNFYKVDEVNEHEFRCIKRRSLECVFCKFKAKWRAIYSFKDHIRKAHINEEAFKCRICKKSFKLGTILKSHLLDIHHISSSGRKYECYLCKEICPSLRALRGNHMRTHTIEGPRRIELEPLEIMINGKKIYKCPLCKFKRPARSPTEFRWHFKEHTGIHIYRCSYCERSFKESTKILRHMKVIHPTKPTLKCALCRLIFYKPDDIDEHEFRCKKRRSFECVFCKFRTKRPNIRSMEDHIRRFHTGVRAFECRICKLTFWRRTCLNQHIREEHPETLPYECSFCLRKFGVQYALQNHENECWATGRRVECSICRYSKPKLTFDKLKIHMQEHNKKKTS